MVTSMAIRIKWMTIEAPSLPSCLSNTASLVCTINGTAQVDKIRFHIGVGVPVGRFEGHP